METVYRHRGLDLRVDELERPYFEAAAEGRLVLQTCTDCDLPRYPPALRCLRCGSAAAHWRESSGRGRVSACVLVVHSVRPEFPAPYAVGLVELDDPVVADPAHAVRILSTVLTADGGGSVPDVVPDGTPVRVRFRPVGPGCAVPEFALAELAL